MRLIPLAWAVLVALATPITQAGIQPVGDPLSVPGVPSWGQRFVYSGDQGQVDQLTLWMVSARPFASPTFRGLRPAGWELTLELPAGAARFAVARTAASGTGLLDFEVWFRCEAAEPLEFIFAAWDSGEPQAREAYRLSWSGELRAAWDCVWEIEPTMPPDGPTIPAPAAATLAGLGLAIVGGFKRRLS